MKDGKSILKKYQQECNQLFESFLYDKYCGEHFTRKSDRIEISSRKGKARHAVLHTAGKYTGFFKDFKGDKGTNIFGWLMENRGMSYPESIEHVVDCLNIQNDTSIKFEPIDKAEVKRLRKYTELQAKVKEKIEKRIAIAVRKEQVNQFVSIVGTPAEKYLVNVRGFRELPQFFKDMCKWNPVNHSIVFPITDLQGNILNSQSIKLDTDGKKVGQKLMEKGGMFNHGWFVNNGSDCVIIGEGVETTMAVGHALAVHGKENEAQSFDYMSRMGTREIKVHHRHQTILLLSDNDDPNSPAYKQTLKFKESLEAQGRAVILLQAIGQTAGDKKDFADMTSKEAYDWFNYKVTEWMGKTKRDKLTTVTVEQARLLLEKKLYEILDTNKNAIFKVGMGIGKTTIAKKAIVDRGIKGNKCAFTFPTHDLLKEHLPEIQYLAKLANLKVRVLEGRRESNCQNLIDINRFVENHNPAMEFCHTECTKRHNCSFLAMLKECEDYNILLTTHARLVHNLPENFPKPDFIVIDEYADGKEFSVDEVLTDDDLTLAMSKYKELVGYNPAIDKARSTMKILIDALRSVHSRSGKKGLSSKEVTHAALRAYKEALYDRKEPYQNAIARKEGEVNLWKEKLKGASGKKRAQAKVKLEDIENDIACDKIAIAHLEKDYEAFNEQNIVTSLKDLLKKARGSLKRTVEYQFQFCEIFKTLYLWEQIVAIIEKQLKNPSQNNFMFYQEDSNVYTIKYKKNIHPTWGNGQRIILDATPTGDYQNLLGKEFETIEIQAKREHLHIEQVVGKGFSKSAIDKAIANYKEAKERGVSLVDMAKKTRTETDMKEIYFNLLQDIQGKNKKDIGIITTKALEEVLKQEEVFKDINTMHWGDIRGKNGFKEKTHLSLYGFSLPPAEHFIRQVELEIGEYIQDREYIQQEVETFDVNEKKTSVVTTTHSNLLVAQKIRNHQNAENMQAIERVRSVNATMPTHVTIYSNVVLQDIPVNTTTKWSKNTFINDQRFTDTLTGGDESFIFENKKTASLFYGDRIKCPQAYKKIEFEAAQEIKELVDEGWQVVQLTRGVKRKTIEHVLIPPHRTIDDLTEQLYFRLDPEALGEIQVEKTTIEFEIEVKQKETTSIYNNILNLFYHAHEKTKNSMAKTWKEIKSYVQETKDGWIERAREVLEGKILLYASV